MISNDPIVICGIVQDTIGDNYCDIIAEGFHKPLFAILLSNFHNKLDVHEI